MLRSAQLPGGLHELNSKSFTRVMFVLSNIVSRIIEVLRMRPRMRSSKDGNASK
jgi:hypothetical protein